MSEVSGLVSNRGPGISASIPTACTRIPRARRSANTSACDHVRRRKVRTKCGLEFGGRTPPRIPIARIEENEPARLLRMLSGVTRLVGVSRFHFRRDPGPGLDLFGRSLGRRHSLAVLPIRCAPSSESNSWPLTRLNLSDLADNCGSHPIWTCPKRIASPSLIRVVSQIIDSATVGRYGTRRPA